MPKNSVGEWSTTAANNSDIAGLNIAEGSNAGLLNNAIRALMAQVAAWLETPAFKGSVGLPGESAVSNGDGEDVVLSALNDTVRIKAGGMTRATFGASVLALGVSIEGPSDFAVRNGAGEEVVFDGVSVRIKVGGVNHTTFDTSGITSSSVYKNTTAQSPNTYIGSSGAFQRSTSARKYKKDVTPISDDMVAAFMSLSGVTYRSRCNADDPDRRHVGLIADEAHAADLPELVHYGNDGAVEGFAYERTTALLLEVVKRLSARVEALEGRR